LQVSAYYPQEEQADLTADLLIVFPLRLPLWIPRVALDAGEQALMYFRIFLSRSTDSDIEELRHHRNWATRLFRRIRLPLGYVTGPIAASILLLAIGAIGRQEVYKGTIGTFRNGPLAILAFTMALSYISTSVEASGLIRWLFFKILQRNGDGKKIYAYQYVLFAALGFLAGTDLVVTSGTKLVVAGPGGAPDLATPRAWYFCHFAGATIASPILVSSSLPNLIISGVFNIPYINWTANMVIPVLVRIFRIHVVHSLIEILSASTLHR
jgi:hypothetical protein